MLGAGLGKRPRDVRRRPELLPLIPIDRALGDAALSRQPYAIAALLLEQPFARSVDHISVYLVNLGHVTEFHEPVCREDGVGDGTG